MTGEEAPAPLLEVRGLSRRFGGLNAVDNLSFRVEQGRIHGLIGPNGAGKTTTFNLISGFHPPSGGRIFYEGRDITGIRTSVLAQHGLVRTFQGTTLFQEFSVFDNVRVGCHLSARAGFLARMVGSDSAREQAADEKARAALSFFDLTDLAGEPTSSLPHGHQRALGMAVALAADPKLLPSTSRSPA
jgi:branched-chain amino acid transport system ATP-binding protein